ncbi:hypothetical protein Pyn_09855 [Prunus yedoensis var. nudiflora]|uniref:Aminotransferase-like plant mobile domain-containing protein n=1 Tax=Prunus yedoensis var. nudiflora TaxID=2094558 RepID=A0A314UUA9_PRUYE|nr:hypothetical protein Pyn_09855 [Prunus yedoensis var. nudiflora]
MASSTSASVEARSQVFQTGFEDICREIQGSVLPNIIVPWADDDGAASDSCLLGPSVEGGMPEKLAVHLKDKLAVLSAFDQGDYQDWNVIRPQQQWPTSTPDWENNFGVEDSAEDDAIVPFGEVEHGAFLLYWLCKFGGRLALGPFLLGHIYRTLHDIITDGMKPKHGGPLWAFQFWLQAYFPELRDAAMAADTEPLANAFARACLARPFPLFLAHDLSVIPDVETENDLREI